jgi:hypothetical protein
VCVRVQCVCEGSGFAPATAHRSLCRRAPGSQSVVVCVCVCVRARARASRRMCLYVCVRSCVRVAQPIQFSPVRVRSGRPPAAIPPVAAARGPRTPPPPPPSTGRGRRAPQPLPPLPPAAGRRRRRRRRRTRWWGEGCHLGSRPESFKLYTTLYTYIHIYIYNVTRGGPGGPAARHLLWRSLSHLLINSQSLGRAGPRAQGLILKKEGWTL